MAWIGLSKFCKPLALSRRPRLANKQVSYGFKGTLNPSLARTYDWLTLSRCANIHANMFGVVSGPQELVEGMQTAVSLSDCNDVDLHSQKSNIYCQHAFIIAAFVRLLWLARLLQPFDSVSG